MSKLSGILVEPVSLNLLYSPSVSFPHTANQLSMLAMIHTVMPLITVTIRVLLTIISTVIKIRRGDDWKLMNRNKEILDSLICLQKFGQRLIETMKMKGLSSRIGLAALISFFASKKLQYYKS